VSAKTVRTKVDLFREHAAEYAARPEPALVEVGSALYLAVDGRGAPGSELFQARLAALYGVAYTVKFASKFAGRDFVVGKLEALYEGAGLDGATPDWGRVDWKMLIRVPEFVDASGIESAHVALSKKGKEGDFAAVRLERLEEGRCVQALHVGPYEEEGETLRRMLDFASERGLRPAGKHHEIYLNDPRRIPPERLKTILRVPVRA